MGLQPEVQITVLEPPEVLYQASNLQYHRSATSQFMNDEQVKCPRLSDISFSFKTSNSNSSSCPFEGAASKSSKIHNAIVISSVDVPSECSAAEYSHTEDGNNCLVCLDLPANAILLECGHSGVCVDCASVLWLQSRRCPVCRKGFAAVMRIVNRQGSSVSWPPPEIEAAPGSVVFCSLSETTRATPSPSWIFGPYSAVLQAA